MYYHFCLLYTFRPFCQPDPGQRQCQTEEICTQVVQSILELTQSYDDLFTLRRVSALIPYFICASGLFSLDMEDGGSHRLRRVNGEPTTINAGIGEGEDDGPKETPAPAPPWPPSSMVLLLGVGAAGVNVGSGGWLAESTSAASAAAVKSGGQSRPPGNLKHIAEACSLLKEKSATLL